MAWDWKMLIPFYNLYELGKNFSINLKNGYQFGDFIRSELGFVDPEPVSSASSIDTGTSSSSSASSDISSPTTGSSASSVEAPVTIPTNMDTNSAAASTDWNKLFRETFAAYKDIQAEDRAYNEKQTLDAWNRTMEASNTAHQREVKDLLAAGLNPWLSVQGSGASSPSSAVASSSVNPAQSISSATSLLSTLANVSLLSQENAQGWLGTILQLIKVLK